MQSIRLSVLALLALLVACTPDHARSEPQAGAQSGPLVGFNEELILGAMLKDKQDPGSSIWNSWCMAPGKRCTENAPPISLAAADAVLGRLYKAPASIPRTPAGGTCPVRMQAVAVHREIITLRIARPAPGMTIGNPFLPAIEAGLRLYAKHDIELVLAFSYDSLPDDVLRDVPDEGTKMARIAEVITDLMSSVTRRGKVDRCWMARRLRIEPMNEFNGFNGTPAMMAVLDNETRVRLGKAGVPIKELVSSSIISGNAADYLFWYKAYYAASGQAVPNIHLYPDADYDKGPNPDARWKAGRARFDAVVRTLKKELWYQGWDDKRWDGYARGMLISETGYPSAGPRSLGVTTRPLDFLQSVRNAGGGVLTKGDRIIVWRIFRDWDGNATSSHSPARLRGMAPGTAENYTYGVIDYWSGKAHVEPGKADPARTLLKNYGKSWSPPASWRPLDQKAP